MTALDVQVMRRAADRGASSGRRIATSLVLAVVLVTAGSLLRLQEYAARRSMLLDESLLALNLRERSFGSLLEQLDFNQLAPPGFLWAEEGVVAALGEGPYALRLLPLLAGVASLPLLYVWAGRLLPPAGALLALAALALLAPPVAYSAIVKPYSGDVLATIAVFLAALPLLEGRANRRQLVAATIVGALALAFSFAAFFALAGIAVGVAWRAVMPSSRSGRLLVPAAAWGVVGLAVFLVTRGGVERLQSTLPADVSVLPERATTAADAGSSLAGRLREVALLTGARDPVTGDTILPSLPVFPVAEAAVVVLAVPTIAGLLWLARRRTATFVAFVAAGAFLVGAVEAGEYPLFARALIFLTPLGAIAFGAGAAVLLRALVRPRLRLPAGGALVAIAVLAVALAGASVARAVDAPPESGLESSIDFVADHARPGDSIYVFYLAQYGLRYYAHCSCSEAGRRLDDLWPIVPASGGPEQYARALHSRPPDVVIGEAQGYESPRYRAEIESLPSKPRVWVLASGFRPSELRFLFGLLDDRGRRVLRYEPAVDSDYATAALYDLREARVGTPSG